MELTVIPSSERPALHTNDPRFRCWHFSITCGVLSTLVLPPLMIISSKSANVDAFAASAESDIAISGVIKFKLVAKRCKNVCTVLGIFFPTGEIKKLQLQGIHNDKFCLEFYTRHNCTTTCTMSYVATGSNYPINEKDMQLCMSLLQSHMYKGHMDVPGSLCVDPDVR